MVLRSSKPNSSWNESIPMHRKHGRTVKNAIEKARQQRDAAQNALNALQNQPVVTPESAEAERQQKIAEAKAALDAAESALAAAQKNAEDANEAATDTAQSYEDARNSAAHTYSQSAEDVAKTNEANQAQATVTQAQLDIALAELSALQSLKAADCVLSAPEDGTLTQLNLEAGQNSTSVAGLLADRNAASVLTFSLEQASVRLATVGTQITVKARKPVYADNHYGFVRSIGRWKYTNYRYVKLRRLEGGEVLRWKSN